ncbi:MAG: indole-3-glycerol phosphate synthase TrpC [Candidatus Omnitrophica bacterium]|nr:indole-3-glycerol phosphate synthase TrpC [Candidatus Omnitrophota bacterium]MBU4303500.1 indole-3-glycerol phosphate synthase TrpC [Candidatus Omnitrophota bacterium]MBU4467439.1 indole-3-glycerol phosphate synthase TrpC [Candidatus Omnitrophota bacterium]MCG2708534.1 indole-3-glycerol phosphate synthase TrpC [Candidatus Omnitrophota bacterium]
MSKTDILKQIVAKKKERILLAKQALSPEDLIAKLAGLPATRPFKEAISKPKQICLIAEIKQASPSRGIIRQNFNLEEIARLYQEAGVQAVSVLTEEDFFSGNLAYLNQVKNIISVPILRKDFILESYQVYESRYFGADAILLIADLLTKDKLLELMQIADSLGLDYLVEVHDEKELKKVLSLKVPIIGINNRNLRTLEIDFKTTEKLFTLIPKEKIVVVESGIKNSQDILFLKILGASAVLIGTAFMEAADIKNKVEEVMGW